MFDNDQTVKNRSRTYRMYAFLGTDGDEVTGTRNDGGQDDLFIVYELHGVYKIKWKVTFRSEIETNGKDKMQLVN